MNRRTIIRATHYFDKTGFTKRAELRVRTEVRLRLFCTFAALNQDFVSRTVEMRDTKAGPAQRYQVNLRANRCYHASYQQRPAVLVSRPLADRADLFETGWARIAMAPDQTVPTNHVGLRVRRQGEIAG